jgi:uncharacterized membrane protein
MKIVNPLNYPLAVLAGGIVLFFGVRLAKLPSLIIIPISVGITLGSATFLDRKQPQTINLENPVLERELENAKQQANLLVEKAKTLREEAQKLLSSSAQIELLTAVEYACVRILELPQKIEQLSSKLHGGDSLLSVEDLEKQLREVSEKQKYSGGVALQQLKRLEKSLQNNIELAQEGQDAREAQVFSLANIIIESAGVLQQLQNRLRTSDLNNSEQIQELKNLSDELKDFQENVDLLV